MKSPSTISKEQVEELRRFNAITEFLAKEKRLHDNSSMQLMAKILDRLKGEKEQSLALLNVILEDGKLLDFLHFYMMGKVDLEALESFRGNTVVEKFEEQIDTSPNKQLSEPPSGQLYAARPDRKESAPAFIERVYGGAGWLSGEFTRADLRKLDAAAVAGLENWERSHGRAPLDLPTLKERNDRRLEAIGGVTKRERLDLQRIAAARRYKARSFSK